MSGLKMPMMSTTRRAARNKVSPSGSGGCVVLWSTLMFGLLSFYCKCQITHESALMCGLLCIYRNKLCSSLLLVLRKTVMRTCFYFSKPNIRMAVKQIHGPESYVTSCLVCGDQPAIFSCMAEIQMQKYSRRNESYY